MEKQVISEFQFVNYKVDYLHYATNERFNEGEIDLDIKINTIFGLSDDKNVGKVTLISKIFEQPLEKNYPFSLEVSLTGIFVANDEMDQKRFTEFLEINGVATLFPFLRSVIADITRCANIDALVLPLINIHRLNSMKSSEQIEQNDNSTN